MVLMDNILTILILCLINKFSFLTVYCSLIHKIIGIYLSQLLKLAHRQLRHSFGPMEREDVFFFFPGSERDTIVLKLNSNTVQFYFWLDKDTVRGKCLA